MTAEFKPGDLVRHKTGGPVMCVACCDESGGVLCEWWTGDGFTSEDLAAVALEHHEPVDGDGIEQGEVIFPVTDPNARDHVLLCGGLGPPEANAGALGKSECRNRGMHPEDHDDGVCPGGETRARW